MSNKRKMKPKTNKPSDEEILFDTIVVRKVEIKPWSFGKLFDISGSLETILDKADEKGLIDTFNSGYFTYTDMAKMFLLFRQELLTIISVTIDKDEDTIRDFSIDKGIKIALAIFNQNKEVLKNALTPLLGQEENKEDEVEEENKEKDQKQN